MVSIEHIDFVEALPADEPTVWLMLTYAASMEPAGHDAIETSKVDAYLRTYVERWGSKAGDLGVIARVSSHGDIGAAWLRLAHGGGSFKLGDHLVPELAMAVLPEFRGRGIGTGMVQRLVAMARRRFPAILLSVREDNRAVRLYERLGFRQTGRMRNRVGSTSLTMRLDLPEEDPSSSVPDSSSSEGQGRNRP